MTGKYRKQHKPDITTETTSKTNIANFTYFTSQTNLTITKTSYQNTSKAPSSIFDHLVIVIALEKIASLIHCHPKTFSLLGPECNIVWVLCQNISWPKNFFFLSEIFFIIVFPYIVSIRFLLLIDQLKVLKRQKMTQIQLLTSI